jgi:hypothetical protein
MATKNVPTKKTSTAVSTGNYEDRLAALAKAGVEQEARVGGGQFISFKSGQISYQGNTIKGNELDVIAIDSIYENSYNPVKFDPDNPQPPVCYALGRDEEELAPHPECADPQSDKCEGCPHNEFGTADNGKGKACKNTRRIAVIPGDPLDEDVIRTAEAAFIRLPVTSVKGWASFVKTVAALEKLPTFGVVATLGTVPDAKTQFKVTWQKKETVDRDLLPMLLERHDAMAEDIMFPYQKPSEEAPKKPAAKGKAPAKRGKF